MGEKDLLGQPPRREICIGREVVVILNPGDDEIPERIREEMAGGRGRTKLVERGRGIFGWLPEGTKRTA